MVGGFSQRMVLGVNGFVMVDDFGVGWGLSFKR